MSGGDSEMSRNQTESSVDTLGSNPHSSAPNTPKYHVKKDDNGRDSDDDV